MFHNPNPSEQLLTATDLAQYSFVASIHNCITYEYETKIDIQTITTKFLDEIEKTDTSEKGALGFFKVSVNSQR